MDGPRFYQFYQLLWFLLFYIKNRDGGRATVDWCGCVFSWVQDVMMLGAVGAYSWSGTVVHQRGSTVDILPVSAFEETLQDRNHSSLLGTQQCPPVAVFPSSRDLL